jgi:hypothetical protein
MTYDPAEIKPPFTEDNLVMIHCDDQGDCTDMDVCTDPDIIRVDKENKVVCMCTDTLSIFAVGIGEDRDEDGIPDVLDDCPDVYDPTNACDGCAADLDEDGDVDGSDLAVFTEAYGSSSGGGTYDPAADFNESGEIDENDLAVTATGFGTVECPLP